MKWARLASLLKLVTYLYSVTLLIMVLIPSGTDASGSLSPLTEFRLLALLASIPLGGALSLCHAPFVLSNDRISSAGKVLWFIAIFAIYPVAGPAYWLFTERRGKQGQLSEGEPGTSDGHAAAPQDPPAR